jgi:hypothetical protein
MDSLRENLLRYWVVLTVYEATDASALSFIEQVAAQIGGGYQRI